MRFVQLLPRRYADARTYNMLVSVCTAARDVTAALHAADMLKSTGRKLDTIMYTNLIAGWLSAATCISGLARSHHCALVTQLGGGSALLDRGAVGVSY